MLALCLLIGLMPMTVLAKEVQIEVSGCDCTRDAGKLVVYTDAYGDSTGTNYWGAEAIVGSDHRVTAITRGNTSIPQGGFVVSGHDNEEPGGKLMKTWIQEHIAVDDYVYFDRRTSMLTVSDQPLDLSESPFFSFDNVADGINVARGEDDMILYTPAHGATTGTNEYGYEVVVEDGVITKLGGNNSAIPSNGYVISLHGATSKWMRIKLVKGMMVEYDPQTLNVVFTYNAEGLRKAVEHSIEQAQTLLDDAKASFVYADYNAAQTALEELRAAYRSVQDAYQADKNDTAFADGCDQLVAKATTLCNSLCESYPVQYRGVWIRPSQKTAAAVDAYVKELHDACINFVCIEGWFENGVIMEVPEDSLFGRHPSFNYDVLQAYIDACHKYGMECHLWMPIMNIGSSIDSGYEKRTVPGQKPAWLSLNNNGQPYNRDGFMMIDPANKEARDYLLEFYRYIVTTYDIDCFEMDYIRYYAATEEADFGYTEAAFEGFEAAYGHGVTPRYDTEADYWEDWCQYRRDCITEWVREIRTMIDREAPDVLLAADVAFPFEHALNKVYQDFPSWLEEGLLDILHPMAYGDGYGEEIRRAVELGGDRCMVVTGLGAQTDMLGATELERQAREDNLLGTYGDCYFEAYTYLKDQVPEAVRQTVYRQEAMPPFLDADASIAAMLDYMVARIDDIILPLGGMSEAEAEAVKAAAAEAKASVADSRIDTEALTALRETIATVANTAARQVLTDDLYRAERITCVTYRLTADKLTDDNAYVPAAPAEDAQPFPLALVLGIAAAVVIVAAAVALFLLRRKP